MIPREMADFHSRTQEQHAVDKSPESPPNKCILSIPGSEFPVPEGVSADKRELPAGAACLFNAKVGTVDRSSTSQVRKKHSLLPGSGSRL